MATKTLTITEDAYYLLKRNKLEEESFSEVIRRLLQTRKKKKLEDFFGIYNEGEAMQRDLANIKKRNIELLKGKIN